MKTSRWIGLVLVVALIGIGFWLLQSTNPDNVTRTDVVHELADDFEK